MKTIKCNHCGQQTEMKDSMLVHFNPHKRVRVHIACRDGFLTKQQAARQALAKAGYYKSNF